MPASKAHTAAHTHRHRRTHTAPVPGSRAHTAGSATHIDTQTDTQADRQTQTNTDRQYLCQRAGRTQQVQQRVQGAVPGLVILGEGAGDAVPERERDDR